MTNHATHKMQTLIDAAEAAEARAQLAEADRDTLLARIAEYKTALADAIRRPMGVIPDSAAGLVGVDELKKAEERRNKQEETK